MSKGVLGGAHIPLDFISIRDLLHFGFDDSPDRHCRRSCGNIASASPTRISSGPVGHRSNDESQNDKFTMGNGVPATLSDSASWTIARSVQVSPKEVCKELARRFHHLPDLPPPHSNRIISKTVKMYIFRALYYLLSPINS